LPHESEGLGYLQQLGNLTTQKDPEGVLNNNHSQWLGTVGELNLWAVSIGRGQYPTNVDDVNP
jgi:hypothetical protein